MSLEKELETNIVQTRKENSIASMEIISSRQDFDQIFHKVVSPNPIYYANISDASKLPDGTLKREHSYNHIISSQGGLTLVNSSKENLKNREILEIDRYTSNLQNELFLDNDQENISTKLLVGNILSSELIYFPHGILGLRANDIKNVKYQEMIFNNLLSEQVRINQEINNKLGENTLDMCKIIEREDKSFLSLRNIPERVIAVHKKSKGNYLVVSDLGLTICTIQSKKLSPSNRDLLLLDKFLFNNFSLNWKKLLFEDNHSTYTRGATILDKIDMVHKHDGLKEILKKESIKDY